MGRRRKHRRDLPAYVYHRSGAYFFVDRAGKWHRLGKEFHEAMIKYAEINSQDRPLFTLASIMDCFQREIVPTTATETQRQYLRALGLLRAVFGHMQADDVEPKDVYGYMSNRPRVAANREKAVLSAVFSFSIRKGLAKDNPCRLVHRNEEQPRDRYVTDVEFTAVRKLVPESVRCTMDLALLTGLREGDVLRLKRTDLSDDGILVKPSKRGKPLLFEWTPELHAAVERAKALPSEIASMFLIHNLQGQPYTTDGFRAIWGRYMNKAIEDKLIAERFTFHDLRAKSGSDHESGAQLGHQDPRTTNRVYRRKPRKVTPLRSGILDK